MSPRASPCVVIASVDGRVCSNANLPFSQYCFPSLVYGRAQENAEAAAAAKEGPDALEAARLKRAEQKIAQVCPLSKLRRVPALTH